MHPALSSHGASRRAWYSGAPAGGMFGGSREPDTVNRLIVEPCFLVAVHHIARRLEAIALRLLFFSAILYVVYLACRKPRPGNR